MNLQEPKKVFKKFLAVYGYHIVKTGFEDRLDDSLKGDFWRDFFASNSILLTECYLNNRQVIKSIDHWLEQSVYEKSLWRYGISERLFSSDIDKSGVHAIPSGFTYSDLISLFGKKLNTVNYLEIGVSAGINFYQMIHSFRNAKIFGMDIEEMNPLLNNALLNKKQVWKSKNLYSFKTFNGKEVKIPYYINEYESKVNNNKVTYLRGDKFSPLLWENLKGQKFNIIFSDAFHNPESIQSEFEYIKDYGLYDPENFIMIWDDLDRVDMQKKFIEISQWFSYQFTGSSGFKIYDIIGTYGGDNNGIHKVGVFSNSPLFRNE